MNHSVIRSLLGTAIVISGFSLPSVLAATSKMDRMPDITQACEKVCPDAANNDAAAACVSGIEKISGGSDSLKKSDPACYNAHAKYEAMLNHPEPLSPKPPRISTARGPLI